MAGRRQYGAIRKLPSGRYQARYRDPLTNRLVAAPGTFKAKAEASRWLASIETNGPALTSVVKESRVRLTEYAGGWISQRTLRPRTEELYRSQLRLHIVPHLGDAFVSKIEPKHVRSWYAALSDGHLSQVSVAKVYRLLRSILTTAVEDQLLTTNPCRIKNGGVERSQERQIPTLEQVDLLSCEMPKHLAATVWIAALAGLRKGEVLGLARRHVDPLSRTIRVERALQEVTGIGVILVEPKTHSSSRTVVIPEQLAEIVDQHLHRHVEPDPDALLFTNTYGRPIRATVWAAAWAGATSAEFVQGIRFHDLRHLAGTLTALAGATLKETMDRLGHSTSGAALRYQHVASNRSREIADAIDKLF